MKNLKKYKNPSILIKKENILKNGKYKIHLTLGMFNKLIKDGVLKYVFTDKRKNYYLQQGGSLSSLFQSILPYTASFAKKLIPSLGVAASSALVSHGINKSLNKRKREGGSININLKQNDINKINKILKNLPIQIKKKLKHEKITSQNGGSILSFLIPIAASILLSLLNKGSGCCKKDDFFEELNNKDNYPMSNLKIDEILKHDKNYIGTYIGT